MKTTNNTMDQATELYFKQATISNILMLQDYLPLYTYTYNGLINKSLDELEQIRDTMIPQYNEAVKQV